MSASFDIGTLVAAGLLGIVEGLTEFIPVSSTGHLILLIDLMGFKGPPGKVFEIVIQFGAILAVLWLYRARFLAVAFGMFTDPVQRRFALNIIAALVPAIGIGAAFGGRIKDLLFSPWVVSCTLILGGIAILAIERFKPKPKVAQVDDYTPWLAFRIGLCQAVAMIPGVSRSGATIMGALLLGADRKSATEFSFFLAVPTMLAACVYDIYRNRAVLDFDSAGLIAIGFVAAFIAALIVVRSVIAFISRYGFQPFAWYRIAIGTAMLTLLLLR
jgi:undecaprenyl-diphosphatase